MGAILPFAAERKLRHARSRHTEEAAAATRREWPRNRAQGGRYCPSDEGNGKSESSGAGRPSRGTAETRNSTRPDHTAGATDSPPSSGTSGISHSSGKTRSLPYSIRRATRRSAETTAASRLCHTRVRFSLKWLPGGSAFTVRRNDYYRRSSGGFDRTARSQT